MKVKKVKYVLSKKKYRLVMDIIDDLHDEIISESKAGALEVLSALKNELTPEEVNE